MTAATRALLLTACLGLGLGTNLHCGTGGLVGGECQPGLNVCGHACVNLGSDPENCGRCGERCAEDERCLVGVCIAPAVVGRPVDGGVLLPDGGLLLPDGAVIDPGNGGSGGSGGGGNGGAGGSSGGNGGSGDGCEPPFNEQHQCGDCDTVCEGDFPLCAPSGQSFECAPSCTDGLTACSGRCVDLETDIDHCGSCNQYCPTAICRDGSCVAATAGHVVTMCMNLGTYRANAPQNSLLGNAIFLASRDTPRVLGYSQYATARVINGVQRAVTEANDKNARDIQLTLTSSSDGVPAALASGNYDVLLVYDQGLAPTGALGTIGASWQVPLESFTAAGGVVIVLSSAEGTGEMDDLLVQSGLLPTLTGMTSATNQLLYNREPSDAVGVNIFEEFRALSSSCTYQIDTGSPAPGTKFIVSDAPRGGPIGNPAVIHGVLYSID